MLIVIGILAALVVFLYFDTKDQPQRLISAGGLVGIILIGLLISKHPGRVLWRQVLWGVGIQFVMGLVVLRWRGGQCAFQCISKKVATFLDFTIVGSDFVYGHLSSGKVDVPGFGVIDLGTVFVFRVSQESKVLQALRHDRNI